MERMHSTLLMGTQVYLSFVPMVISDCLKRSERDTHGQGGENAQADHSLAL